MLRLVRDTYQDIQDFEAIFGLAEAVRRSEAIREANSSGSEAKHEQIVGEQAETVG